METAHATGITVKDGATLQRVYTQIGTASTGTTVMALDNTIPQSNEGDEYMTRTITPSTGTSILNVRATIQLANSANVHMIAALFKDGGNDALTAVKQQVSGTNVMLPLHLEHSVVAGGVSEITFKIRAGGSGAGTTTCNGASGSGLFGGIALSSLVVEETKA
jgi:hypothetical protein